MTDGLTPRLTAWLDSQAHREAFENMTAAQLNALPMSEYARLTGREFTVQPMAGPIGPPAPQQATEQPAPQTAPQPQGIDVSGLSMSDYEQVRGQLGMGAGHEYGRGILDAGSAGRGRRRRAPRRAAPR